MEGIFYSECHIYHIHGRTDMDIPRLRFEVWDDLGKLRAFYTRVEATRFCQQGVHWVVVLPKVTPADNARNMLEMVGEAPF